ncbi:MAG: TIGR03663 family protein [Verrucomicrobiota bacterium]|nr:TIGR03663 family protein [Chthoniobacterales bacterium]MDQ3313695.1 TIGR03663 family protein [Verrucomicrobiota bacterium]
MPWIIIALGVFLRFLLLGMKPPHFDEGINGWFVDQMTKTGFYRYDPTNYHGPFHFYVEFLAQTLLGRNLWALRLPVVLASTFCIWLTMRFEPLVGRRISRLAAVAMAVSPGFVFYGRYSIHEVWLLLFSMLFILGLLGLWKVGTSGYLWCAGMGLSGMILTKETYIIHVGCAVLAAVVAWISHQITSASDAKPVRQVWANLDFAVVIAVGLAAIIFFYSGTFYNWNGVKGLYETFNAWFATGHNGNGHEKPWNYWLKLIGRYEPAIAIGLLGCVACQMFKTIALRYLAIYGAGTLAAYSIVHYKTPWCIISIVWPLLFVFGAAVLLPADRFRRTGYIAAGVVLAVSLALSVRLNYFRCTTDTEPYVYVQTYNDIFKLTDPLLKLAHKNPTYYQLVGHFIRTSAYPLPWTLGDFPRIGYYEKDNLPSPIDADVLVVQEDKIALVEAKLQGSYYTMPFTIRPYQDTSKLYFSAKMFKDFFQGRVPDFVGKGSG